MFGYTIIKTSELRRLEHEAGKKSECYVTRQCYDEMVEKYKTMVLKIAERRDEAKRALADERQQRIQLAELVGRYDEICRKVREMQGIVGSIPQEE